MINKYSLDHCELNALERLVKRVFLRIYYIDLYIPDKFIGLLDGNLKMQFRRYLIRMLKRRGLSALASDAEKLWP